jgi:hypothetical protein
MTDAEFYAYDPETDPEGFIADSICGDVLEAERMKAERLAAAETPCPGCGEAGCDGRCDPDRIDLGGEA